MSIDTLTAKYMKMFEVWPPRPVNVLDEDLEKQLKIAIEKGEPIPMDFDWYEHLSDEDDT